MIFQTHRVDEDIKSAYGLTTADINGDGLTDIVVGSTGEKTVAWYEAPTFEKHIISSEHLGTICLATHDLTRNGKLDVIAGSGFGRRDRSIIEYLHWFEQPDGDSEWKSHRIDTFPYIHRLASVDFQGTGEPVLIVASIRGFVGDLDDWSDPGVLWLYEYPEDPYGEWPHYAIAEDLHLNHGLSVCDVDDDGRQDILIGARDGLIWYEPPAEGLTDPWSKWVISETESSETWAYDIDGDGVNEILSIEPWHGNELVIYKCKGDIRRGPWERTIVDATLHRGHSIQAIDVDGDGVVELVCGYNGKPTSLHLYRPEGDGWVKEPIDDELGMGQMEVLDLDGDGRLEIVATGMSTGNVRHYSMQNE
ncbi:TPA: hypothetical protein DCE37_17365 [Candidatus Latescibacteria bacterium]|nr:hypothetical protein [Candidatus Latescibacterota bacterium]